VLDDPDAPAAQALRHAARGLVAATPQEDPVLQEPAGPPLPGVPEVTGTALPMAR
jgi:ATP-binding protein involved in chromosome partitioning